MSVNFIIAAPPYSPRSGGIMVLHELCTALNKLNYKAGVVFITEGSQAGQNFKFGFSNEASLLDPNGLYHDFFSNKTSEEISNIFQNACVIYPDIIKGNPLSGKSFATYVLGKPAFPIVSDFILSYSKIYIENSDFILHKPFLSEHMHDRDSSHWSQRNLSLTYIGKGAGYTDCSVIPGTVLIERDWPKDKQQLATLLRNCKYFFSWDCVSATNVDALLCGAVPVLMHDLQIPRNILNDAEYGPYPPIQYEPGMDFTSQPNNSVEIDAHIANFKIKFHEHFSSWTNNVASFAKLILAKHMN